MSQFDVYRTRGAAIYPLGSLAAQRATLIAALDLLVTGS